MIRLLSGAWSAKGCGSASGSGRLHNTQAKKRDPNQQELRSADLFYGQ